jgi:hypothetical protein
MMTTLNELLGEKLIQYNQCDNKSHEIPTSQLDGRTIGLYFS